jgi:chromosome segregation ATPase
VQIGAARPRGENDPGIRRATELAGDARSLVLSLERTKAAVAEHQARVDRLEAQGRAFRTMLGNAIDTLSRDRSRERAHLEAVEARSARISEDATTLSLDRPGRDSLLWEQAALEAEERKARGVDRDLGFQIEELHERLQKQNTQLDHELALASGELEGALSALRRMTGELVRAIEEAAAVVGR